MYFFMDALKEPKQKHVLYNIHKSCSRRGGGGGEQGVCEGSSHPGEAAASACLECGRQQ